MGFLGCLSVHSLVLSSPDLSRAQKPGSGVSYSGDVHSLRYALPLYHSGICLFSFYAHSYKGISLALGQNHLCWIKSQGVMSWGNHCLFSGGSVRCVPCCEETLSVSSWTEQDSVNDYGASLWCKCPLVHPREVWKLEEEEVVQSVNLPNAAVPDLQGAAVLSPDPAPAEGGIHHGNLWYKRILKKFLTHYKLNPRLSIALNPTFKG